MVSVTQEEQMGLNPPSEPHTGDSRTQECGDCIILNQSQGEMHIRRIPSNRGRTDFNVRAVELYLAAATRTHHLRNVDPTLALV